MKKYIIISILVLFSANAGAQINGQSYDITMSPYWDFYSLNYQSVENAGKGYTGIASTGDIMSSTLNPAAFNIEKKYQAYIEYDLKNNMQWLNISDDLKLKQTHPLFAAGFGYKINKDLQTGIIFRSERNWMLDLGQVIVMNEWGQITGKYDAFETFSSHTLSVPVAYKYKYLNFGVNLNLVLLHGRNNLGYINNEPIDVNNNYVRFIPDFGIKITPDKNFSLGITYTPGIEQQVIWDYPSPIVPDTMLTYFPMKLGIGFESSLLEGRLHLSGEYRYERTSVFKKENTFDWSLKDRHNLNFGAEYLVDNKFTVRAGVFTFFDVKNEGSEMLPINDLSQFNGTIGFGYKYNNVKFNAAIINAFSKQADFMHVNIGATYDF